MQDWIKTAIKYIAIAVAALTMIGNFLQSQDNATKIEAHREALKAHGEAIKSLQP